jgi:hypothetical protein
MWRWVKDKVLNRVKDNIQELTYKKRHHFAENNFKITCPFEMTY